MTAVKDVKSASTAAALKAERERDMAQAMREYEDEQRALKANMARLRALRVAKEHAESKATAAPQSAKKKAATSVKAATSAKATSAKAATSVKKKAAPQTGREPRATS